MRENLIRLYESKPRWVAALAGTALLGVLAGIHALLAYSSAFRPLYVLPIWLATRIGGRTSGFVLVVFSTLIGTATEWESTHLPGENVVANLIIRFGALGFLMLLIAQVEQALAKHQRMALRDPLTGLLNRHALKRFGQSAFDEAAAHKRPTTVVVIDCDHFKLLNDTHGHKAGDHVLTLLASQLETQTRESDVVARIGGDEFAVVLRDTTVDEARQIMRRVDESFVANAGVEGFATGLSIGYGTTSEASCELDTVLEAADRSMYQHKRQKQAFLG